MRIIGGKFKGRPLFQPKTSKTRPLSDSARESLFNVLGDIEGLTFLDCYAGSGAVGLEAISRGAPRAAGVEAGQEAIATIKKNAAYLGCADNYRLYEMTVEDWLKRFGHKDKYHIVYAGPPFGQATKEIMEQLAALLEDHGLLVVETARREKVLELEAADLIKSRRYGESVLTFYRRQP